VTRTITADHAERLPVSSECWTLGWFGSPRWEAQSAHVSSEEVAASVIWSEYARRERTRVISISLPVILSASAAGAVCELLLRALAW